MTFLQPFFLAALPLIALPIVIHLINRQRHRTVEWGAMMFLLDAKRLTRGIDRLRYWLIMAMRMLAVAALLFAVARPLASGRLGLTLGGTADATLILLDRSSSMQQQNVETGETKREAALRKLQEYIQTRGKTSPTILIESTESRATAIEQLSPLDQQPGTGPTDSISDLPAMFQTALDYVERNQLGRTDVWVCTDLRTADWRPDDGRWTALRERLTEHEGVRFYLLTYPEIAPHNLAVRVENAEIAATASGCQLVLDVVVSQSASPDQPTSVPLEIVINGARSVFQIELTDIEYRLQGHTIALDKQNSKGWGYVELPSDANLSDNRFYFVFGDAPARHTVIVTEQAQFARAIELAVTSPVNPALSYSAQTITPEQLDTIQWQHAALIVWQASLPTLAQHDQLVDFVESGRPVVFFPPLHPDDTRWVETSWERWEKSPADQPWRLQTWRGDADLLQHTRSGRPLPLSELRVFRYCALEGRGVPLATLDNSAPLLTRGSIGNGFFYFFTTLPTAAESSLLRDGVSFFVILHRALASGAATLSQIRQHDTGSEASEIVDQWQVLAGDTSVSVTTDRAYLAGAYQFNEELMALNRPASEDRTAQIDTAQIEQLLQGLDYRIVAQQIGSASALANEVWRSFLVIMAVALFIEALLCLPERRLAALRLPPYPTPERTS